ncbi:hypothetical protein [Engelhardtia mirabilis]|uniref:Uncharacterized protein n=1 Tax=Engelhardtia mirabilis TaxID=2528011 RepID=A0A518BSI8_9BACT|nr:hypothetical protein Pla133_50660 [Planctomycetes bacterium Pla133]QDV04268.1 hypothetical protein Pla86_50630 [Planctomycetes bacterium Pla86]
MKRPIEPAAIAVLLVLLGVVQMAASLVGSRPFGDGSRMLWASPAPGWSPGLGDQRIPITVSQIFLQWRGQDGEYEAVELDAERLARLRGPAPRRALYRLALARGPELVSDPSRRDEFRALLEYALCGERPLLAELGIDPASVAGEVSLQYQRVVEREDDGGPIVIEAPCP